MLSLERFAALRAAIEREGDREAVLRKERMAAPEWIQLQRHWLDALATEIAKGGSTLATRYGQAFAAGGPNAAESEPSLIATPPLAPLGAAHVPTYLQKQPSPSIRDVVLAPAIAIAERHAAPVAKHPVSQGINETTEVRAIPEGPVLPFTNRPTPEPSAKILAPAEPRPRPSHRDPRDETAFLPSIVDLKPSLPFTNANTVGGARRVEVPVTGRPSSGDHKTPARDPRDETAAVPSIRPGEETKPTMPFVKASDAQRLTLEQYASLCAELGVHPEQSAQVLKRYGFENDEARKREDQSWATRLQTNESQMTRFKELVAIFRAHLERTRGR